MSNQNPTSTTKLSTRPDPSSRRWFIDLRVRNQQERSLVTGAASASTDSSSTGAAAIAATTTTAAAAAAANNLLLTPVGFCQHSGSDITHREDDDRLIARRSWDIALQPIKQLPMNMIFAWMAGNSFSLMSIMIVVMLFMKPIQSMFSLGSAFASLEQEGLAGNIWLLKIIYLLGNLTHLALALYKCQSMGLLPTYNSDWIAFADQQTQMEMTVGGLSFS